MENLDIPYIIANKKLKRVNHWYTGLQVIGAPIILIALMSFNYYNVINAPDEKLPYPKILLMLAISIVIVLCVLLLFITNTRLKENVAFKTIATPFSKERNRLLGLKFLRQYKCEVTEDTDHISGATRMSAFSWGEQITIIPLDKEILVNSHPDSIMQLITIIKDVRNISRFEQMLKNEDAHMPSEVVTNKI